jgi:hypothetical protein
VMTLSPVSNSGRVFLLATMNINRTMNIMALPTAAAERANRDARLRPVSFTPTAYVAIQTRAINASSQAKRGSLVNR